MKNDQRVSAGALFCSICRVTGQKVQGLIAEVPGTHQMVTTSPFRAIHRVDPIDDAVLRANPNEGERAGSKRRGRSFDCQALIRLSSTRLRRTIQREVSSAIVPDCASWLSVRDTVSIVKPR